MKRAIRYLGVILLLYLSLTATAQIQYSDPAKRDLAKQIGVSARQTIKTKEPKWKLKDNLDSEFGFHQYFKSRSQEVELSIFVYDSPEEASKQLRLHSMWSSLTASSPLKGFEDEAFYISHR